MIGWYVHHHGSGHLTRATCIVPELGEPVVGLSSLPPQPGFDGWVRLPPDAADPAADPALLDATARDTLHWVPRRSAGVADRAAAITAWVAAARPRLVVVDVSVEAALLVRLAGVPVAVVALPGDRGDTAHQRALAAADLILACWRRPVYDPSWLHPHLDRTVYVGAVSRFDGRPRVGAGRGGVVVLDGTGGTAGHGGPTDRGWRILSGGGRVADPWPLLCAADVVVTHAGQNALAEVAAARRPAVVVAQPRPFAEQERTAAALDGAGIAVRQCGWDADWPAVLARARGLDPAGWARWSGGDGAGEAARAIAAVR